MDALQKLLLSKDTLKNKELIKVACETTSHIDIGSVEKAHVNEISIGKDVFADVELVTSYTGDNQTILNSIDKTQLLASKRFLETLLVNPIDDINTLKNRQSVLKNISSHHEQITELLKHMKTTECDVAWLYSHKDEEICILYDMIYFTNVFMRPLNNINYALTSYNIYRIILSPLLGLFTPIIYFIIPYFVFRLKLGYDIGFVNYLKLMFKGIFSGGALGSMFPKMTYLSTAFSLIFYFQGLFNSVEVAKACYKISKLITNRMHGVAQFMKSAKSLFDLCWDPQMGIAFFNEPDDYEQSKSIKQGLQNFNVFSNFGTSLQQFKTLDTKNTMKILRRACIIDTLNSIVKLQINVGYTFANYSQESSPFIDIKGIWHPSLTKVVKNDIHLDKSLILTGPNAGGKSTLIKSILISILLSQTITIVNATKLDLTPFAFISSQINIPDCKGKESLFEAEMNRSKNNLEMLQKQKDKPSIIFMDEIFNSTNPVEGIAGAFAIAKNMSNFTNNLMVCTTHYTYLTKLAKDLPDKFVNMKMNVRQPKNKKIEYPYKVSSGISHQYIALELLKQNGFHNEIIEDALTIKNALLRQK